MFVKPLQVAAKPEQGLCSPGARTGCKISSLSTAWGYFPARVWGVWFSQLNHTGEVGTGDLQPLLMPPQHCPPPCHPVVVPGYLLVSRYCVVRGDQSRVTDEPSSSPGSLGMAQGRLCPWPCKAPRDRELSHSMCWVLECAGPAEHGRYVEALGSAVHVLGRGAVCLRTVENVGPCQGPHHSRGVGEASQDRFVLPCH